ncbi:MAG: putative MFS-type transporter YcaD [Chlamydiae bacterium]|nr:putative MFS-type transporter YcaD [Chlamydiota bacterium]
MLKLFKSIVAPLLSLAIVMVSVGLFSTFVPLRLTLDGHSSIIAGAVTSAYFAGLVLGSLKIESFIARVGYIRTFAALASMTGAIATIMGLLVKPYLWIFLRFSMGVFTAGIYIVIESWLLVVGGNDRKGVILAFYMIAFYAAQAGGQFLLNVAPPMSFIPFSLATLFISLSVVPVCLTKHSTPFIEEPSLLTPLQLLKISTFGILSTFGSGLIMGAFFGLAPVFAHNVGMVTSEVATYMGVTIIGGFVLQWPLGKLSDMINRRSVLIGVSFITSILAILIALASIVSTNFLSTLTVLFGGFAFTMYPLSISYTNDYLDPKDVVAATGGLLVCYGIGSVVGPLLAPLCMNVFGPSGLYVYFSVISSLVGGIGLYRKRFKPSIPLREQVEYRPIPRTTPMVSELDPRSSEKKENLEESISIDSKEELADSLSDIEESEEGSPVS